MGTIIELHFTERSPGSRARIVSRITFLREGSRSTVEAQTITVALHMSYGNGFDSARVCLQVGTVLEVCRMRTSRQDHTLDRIANICPTLSMAHPSNPKQLWINPFRNSQGAAIRYGSSRTGDC